jgi:hypothetical protein
VKEAPAPNSDWQRLWFSAREHDWNSLALVPGDSGVDVVQVAETLATTGRLYGEKAVTVLNGRGVQLTNVHQLIDTLGVMTGRGDWVIVPVDAVSENPSSIPIVQATSAALFVVRLGESFLSSARSAIEAVGRERFLGSIVIDTRGQKGRPVLQLTLPPAAFIVCL